MKILVPIVLILITGLASGQVGDGSVWSDGLGTVATVDVVDSGANGGAGNVTVTDNTGFTDPLNATMAEGSTAEKPKADSSAAGETNSPAPNEYRVKNGKLQKKNSKGKWVDMKKSKKKSSVARPEQIVTTRSPSDGPNGCGRSGRRGPENTGSLPD